MVRDKAPLELAALVARRIKALRGARGLTQDAVAEALGMAAKNVQRLEAGRQNLTLQSLQNIADVLNVEPYELLREPTSIAPANPELMLRRALRAVERLGHRVYEADAPRSREAVPVLTLQAAASSFGRGRDVETLAWIKIQRLRASRGTNRFVAQILGRSMSPGVPSGALALFRAPIAGPLEGRVVLAQWRDYADPETGGSYVLKRLSSVEPRPTGGVRIRLQSDNPEFPPLLIEAEEARELRLLAELERVLWPPPRK